MRLGIFLFVAVVLLAALWALLRPLSPAPPATEVETAVPVAAAPIVRRLHIEVPPPAGAPAIAVLKARAGDEIELDVRSAEDDELHLHGYDLSLPLRAGEPATLRFTAEHAGRFEIELHGAHTQVAVLEISPR
ncbi:hypothetical protein [Sinimarinibacterium thermocellulolyticum]|uniref:EfeO-type cupredoxin-like domain-containing protein n=1 Tax=Sinimarinibacterium thermocellulolyticum TaxID=3170016 RepID=A0ABV2AAD2_9GAMM